MATTTTCTSTTSSFMLTYATSTVHPQDLTPSLLSFKPQIFSVCPLISDRKSSNRINFYSQTEAKSRPCRVVVAAALAAEAEVGEEVEETEGEGGGVATATVTPTKPKKGKAALPLKRDRVCVFLFACFVNEFWLFRVILFVGLEGLRFGLRI